MKTPRLMPSQVVLTLGEFALLGQQQPLDDPGLAAHLGQDPARGRGDVRERDRGDRRPQEPARPLELPLPVEPRADDRDQEHQHAREGHHPHRPVDDLARSACSCRGRTCRCSCFWSWLRPCTLPLNEPVAMYESSFGILIEKLGVWSLCREAADLEEREAARLAGVPLRLGGGDLHALRARDGLAEAVADDELEQRRPAPRRSAPASPPCRKRSTVAAAQEVPAADAEHRRSTRRSARRASCARTRAARTRSTAAPRRSSAAPRRSRSCSRPGAASTSSRRG